MITQARVRELFDYDPESGVVTRKITTSSRAIKGDVVGSLQRRWGYLTVSIGNKSYKLHRIIYLWMTGEFPPQDTDHGNHIRSDNRWDNLQAATRLQNGRNMKLYVTNTSGVCGVVWNEKDKKWMARIHVDGEQIYLGIYSDKCDAIEAREAAEALYGFHPNHGRKAA